ncbi:MAG: NAD(P)-binding domain-containing protein [Cyanobacteria bacterium J06649_5]
MTYPNLESTYAEGKTTVSVASPFEKVSGQQSVRKGAQTIIQKADQKTGQEIGQEITKKSDQKSDRETSRSPSVASDPFGVNRAVIRAIEGPSWWRALSAQLIDWSVVICAVLPVPLALTSLWVMFVPGVSPWPRLVAGLFLAWAVFFIVDQLRRMLFDRADNTMHPTEDRQGQSGSVIVVGAGPVGLATLKECLAEGLEVKCFDRQDGVGGVFRYNQTFSGGCWPTVRLTSSPWVTAYADFPPDSESSKHYTTQQYVDYLERYVQRFELGDHLHFGQTVTAVEQTEKGKWRVTTLDRQTGEKQYHYCDRVSVSVGLHLNPKPVDLPGQDTFTGEVRHSSTYKGSKGLAGKRVVVVGAGESGVDIATELSHVASEAFLSLRSGKFIIPRINPLNGVANDYDTNRIRNAPPSPLRNWFMQFKRQLCFHTGEHTPEAAFRAQLLAVSSAGPASQTVTKSDDFVHRVMAGKLALRKNVVGFDRENVLFADGTHQPVDVVLFAHGYTPVFPFLKHPDGVLARHPGDMFVNMFHPDIGDSIGFCGFVRPAIGAIPPTGELQARLFAQVAAGKRVLPERPHMLKAIEMAKQENAAMFPTQPQPSSVISWIPYMDKIAGLVGCKPQPLKLLAQPQLLWSLCAGPMTGAYYRLHGPGHSEAALKTIRSLPRMHRLSEIVTYLGLHFWTWPLQVAHPNPRWRPSISLF